MAQLRQLKWSRLNHSLFSLCFAMKAKANIVCAFCVSDSHTSEACPDNPANFRQWGWQSQEPAIPSRSLGAPGRSRAAKICYLFNKRAGNKCIFNPCRYLHVCLACKGSHPRSGCPPQSGEPAGGKPKRPCIA